MATQLNDEFHHRATYEAGSQVLQRIGWKPNSAGMFKAPSRAKRQPLHQESSALATLLRQTIEQLMDNALLSARIDHFIAIGGARARGYFLGDHCRLDIAHLGRRMPPLILSKFDDLYAGSGNFDSNPTGAPPQSGAVPFLMTISYPNNARKTQSPAGGFKSASKDLGR